MDASNTLNTLDLGIIALIGFSAIFGVMRGFVRESMSLVTWVTAAFIATFYCTKVAAYLTFISMMGLRYLIAFLLLVMVTLIIGGIVSFWISRLITLTGFSITDRVVGTMFGVLRGILVVAIAVLVAGSSTLVQQPLWKTSQLIPHFQPLAAWIKTSLPDDLLKKFSQPSSPAQATPQSLPQGLGLGSH